MDNDENARGGVNRAAQRLAAANKGERYSSASRLSADLRFESLLGSGLETPSYVARPMSSGGRSSASAFGDLRSNRGAELQVAPVRGKHEVSLAWAPDHSALRERLSERDLDMLEFKTKMVKEQKALRQELHAREADVVSREASLRKLAVKLQTERDQLRADKASHDQQVTSLRLKVQGAVQEINRLNNDVYMNSQKRSRNEADFKKTLAKRDSQILHYQRQVELLESQLEVANEKLNTSSRANVTLRQNCQEAQRDAGESKSRVRVLENNLQLAKAREAELEASLDRLREERDRAEDMAATARTAAEKSRLQLQLEQERHAADQQLDVPALPAPQPAQAPSSKHLHEVKTELRNCIVQLQDWRKRVEDLETRNRQLKAELHESKQQLQQLREQGADSPARGNASSDEQLASKLHEMEERVAEAEWERVEQENRAGALEAEQASLRASVQDKESRVAALLKRLKEEEQGRTELERENFEVVEQLTKVQGELEQVRAALVSAQDARPPECDALAALVHQARPFLEAVQHLTGLLATILDGGQPSMEMLLDEVSATKQTPSQSQQQQRAQTPQERSEAEVAAAEELSGRLKAMRNSVLEARSRIADRYAQSLGSDCQVQ